jgi:hypothetical protein
MFCRERSGPCRINGAEGFGVESPLGRAIVGVGAESGVAVELGAVRELCVPPREREEEPGRAGAAPLGERAGELGVAVGAEGGVVNWLPPLFLGESNREEPLNPRCERVLAGVGEVGATVGETGANALRLGF